MKRLDWVVVAALVVAGALAAVWFAGTAQYTHCCGQTPLGSILAISFRAHSSNAAGSVYNFTVASVASGYSLMYGNLFLGFESPQGTTVSLPTSAYLTIMVVNSTVVATYSFTPGTWSSGGNHLVTPGDVISTYVGSANVSSGSFIVSGTSPFGGEISVPIP